MRVPTLGICLGMRPHLPLHPVGVGAALVMAEELDEVP